MATTSAVRIPERYNASRLLDDNLAAGRADKVAVVAGTERITYGELLRTASRYGAALRELGAARGDRVLLALDDCTSFPAVFLGAMRAGLVPVPVNPLLGAEDYAYFASDSGAALIVVDAGRAEKVADGCRGARIVLVGGGVDGLDSLEDAAASQPDELAPVDTHRDDAAFWLYSSGSTGRPKGVVHL